ncbi:MAG: glycoside hydrolase family 5 protein [Lachnospiraceae bacterium]|nr:glycoside hydrolase family 5 protein [Lachnospiraceae bacterium]
MKNRRKKTVSVLLTLMLAVSLFAACGKETEQETPDNVISVEEKQDNQTENAEEQNKQKTDVNEKADTKVSEWADDGKMRPELTSLEIADLMGGGINLGNTMEAIGGRMTNGVGADPIVYETSWGQPVTTQAMIDGMKAAGFDTLRIPVGWTSGMHVEDKNYDIDDKFMARVTEIVNYARNAGMYVIINDHWDNGWWGMFGSDSEETVNEAMKLYTSMWKQIAENFKDYSDYLIFESANEELGARFDENSIFCSDSETTALSTDEKYRLCNEVNQAFVDTVRATDGNNSERFLLIAGYGTDINNTIDERFKLPDDTASNRLLISVHYYDPSQYCINDSVDTWGSKTEYSNMNNALAKMKVFTDKGVGVVIGEYGVLMPNGTKIKDGAKEYTANLLNNCDVYGFVPVLWDCNNLFNRQNASIIDPDMATLYLNHSAASQALIGKSYVDMAQKEMQTAYENATDPFVLGDDEAIAWLMYSSSDWSISYSVGDTYTPESKTEGVVPTDVYVTGAGEYTVGLDFTGTAAGYADSLVFSAVGIDNGEKLFPGCLMTIKEIVINGNKYDFNKLPYCTSDDGNCTRINLYNEWITKMSEVKDIRTPMGRATYASPTILDPQTLGHVESIYVTFKLTVK